MGGQTWRRGPCRPGWAVGLPGRGILRLWIWECALEVGALGPPHPQEGAWRVSASGGPAGCGSQGGFAVRVMMRSEAQVKDQHSLAHSKCSIKGCHFIVVTCLVVRNWTRHLRPQPSGHYPPQTLGSKTGSRMAPPAPLWPSHGSAASLQKALLPLVIREVSGLSSVGQTFPPRRSLP